MRGLIFISFKVVEKSLIMLVFFVYCLLSVTFVIKVADFYGVNSNKITVP